MPFVARCHWCSQPFIRWNVDGLSCWICPTPACQARQEKWALSIRFMGKPHCVYMPLPKQVEAIETVLSGQYRWILYGGARGGAKSHFLRWLAYYLCLLIPGFQVVLLRRTYPELEKSHLRRVGSEVKRLGGIFVPSARPPVVRFPNESVFEFGQCQDSQDIENFQSAEYHLVLFDETGTFEEDWVLKIGASARLKTDQFRPCVVGSTNPGAMWVRDRWIRKEVDPTRYKNYDPDQYHFIQSLLDDNPYPDDEYEQMLNELDPDTYNAWRLGSWDTFEGQYFKEFTQDRHCCELEIPPDVPRLGGFDWGYSPDPAVMLFAVALPDGRLHIEQELVFRETVASDVARHIMQHVTDHGWSLYGIHTDPSTKIRGGQTGESIFETLSRGGLAVIGANHERINGWQRLRHWLRDNPVTHSPWLTISPSGCPGLVRTLPSLTHDETRREDVNTHGPDHWADALRYLVMGRPAPTTTHKIVYLPPESLGAMMQEAMQTHSPLLGADRVRS